MFLRIMSLDRPETSVVPLDSGDATAFNAEVSMPLVGAESYVPSVLDLIMPLQSLESVRALAFSVPYFLSEAADTAQLIGYGASFTVTRQRMTPVTKRIRDRPLGPRLNVEFSVETAKRPEFVVYKSARLSFLEDGKPASAHDRRTLQSILMEFRVLQYRPFMKHPNIIGFFGIAWGNNLGNPMARLPILVVEHGDRGTLNDVLSREKPLSDALKLDICLGIARGLDVLHQNGIIHGDVKPENIIMCSHEEKILVPKLADFGFAIVDSSDTAKAKIGGTRTWCAPEAFSLHPVSQLRLSDTYSFGLVAWAVAIDGKNPFGLMLTISDHDQDYLEEVHRLKMSDEVLGFSKPEQWLPKWIPHHLVGFEAINTFRQQPFWETLELIFTWTLSKEPTKRDLAVAIEILA